MGLDPSIVLLSLSLSSVGVFNVFADIQSLLVKLGLGVGEDTSRSDDSNNFKSLPPKKKKREILNLAIILLFFVLTRALGTTPFDRSTFRIR